MSLIGLILGVFAQACFAFFQFMLVGFSGGSLANGRELAAWQSRVLDLSLLVLPGVSVAVCALLVYFYVTRSPYLSHAWHLVPVGLCGAYLGFATLLSK